MFQKRLIYIDDDANINEIEKIYNKHKSKIPVSFKNYFESIFSGKERYYLTDSYEKYIDELYTDDNSTNQTVENKSGKISVIILSIIMLVIAIVGYLVFKKMRGWNILLFFCE